MPIVVDCSCGKKLKAADGSAGRRVKCPACGTVLVVPAPEPELDGYELAEPAPEPARSGVEAVATPSAESSRLDSPIWKDATRRAAQRDQAAAGPQPLCNVLGIEVTWARAATFAVVMLLLLGGGAWFFMSGPGAKSKLLSVHTVTVTPLLEGLDTREPYNLFTGTGDRSLGVKGPKRKSVATAGTFASVDMVYSLGGSDELLLTQPAGEGKHLLVEVQLAHGLFDAHAQATHDYKINISPDAFALTPVRGGTPMRPRVLFASFDRGVALDMAGAKTSGYQVLLPVGIKPASEKLDIRHGGPAIGTVSYDSPDAKGEFNFVSAYFISGAPGVHGLNADGKVTRTAPDGTAVDYEYQGGTLALQWTSPVDAAAWWSKPRYAAAQGSSFAKVRIALLFDRPDGDEPQVLTFVTHRIGTVKPESASRRGASLAARGPAAAPQPEPERVASGQGVSEPVTAYLQALADARKKAQGVVAMSNMNQIGLAIGMYAEQNKGNLPESLHQLRTVMPAMDQMLFNQRTGENPGFIYERPAERFSQIANPARTPMLWESRGGRKDEAGAVLYADGHIETGRRP
jgi:hypothetical protein